MASAFSIRIGESHLSVNWLEYFVVRDGTDDGMVGTGAKTGTKVTLNGVRETLRSKGFRLRSNGRFALLNVGTVKTTIRRAFGRSLHINHLPLPDDASHAGILGYTEEDRMIAAEIRAAVRAKDVRVAV